MTKKNTREEIAKKSPLVAPFEEYMEAVSEELKTWQNRRNRTIYISRKQLQKDSENEVIDDFFLSHRAMWLLENTKCKYFIYDPKQDTLKPSKRK